jgi:hypothetical protein
MGGDGEGTGDEAVAAAALETRRCGADADSLSPLGDCQIPGMHVVETHESD